MDAQQLAKLGAAEIEMLRDADRHGCQRCWSDDLQLPCTCAAERGLIKMAINSTFNRVRRELTGGERKAAV